MQDFFAYNDKGFEPLFAKAQTPEDYQALMDFLNWHLAIIYDGGEYSTNLHLYLQLKIDKLENRQDIPPLTTFPELSALPLPDGISPSDASDVLLRDVDYDGGFELLFGFAAEKLLGEPDTDEPTYSYGIMIFDQNEQTGAYEPMTLANGSTIYQKNYDDITYTKYDSLCTSIELLALEALGL